MQGRGNKEECLMVLPAALVESRFIFFLRERLGIEHEQILLRVSQNVILKAGHCDETVSVRTSSATSGQEPSVS